MKHIIDPNELIKQIPELAKAYMDLCFTAAQKNDGYYVWLDEDGEDWWLNIQTSLTKPVHIDKGFKIFPVEANRYTAVGKFFTAISEAMDFIVNYKPGQTTKTYAVDVHWDVAKTYYIEASSRDEAIKKMEKTPEYKDMIVHRVNSRFFIDAVTCAYSAICAHAVDEDLPDINYGVSKDFPIDPKNAKVAFDEIKKNIDQMEKMSEVE